MTRGTLLYSAAALVMILALGGAGNAVSASFPDTLQEQTLDSDKTHQSEESKAATDGAAPTNMAQVLLLIH